MPDLCKEGLSALVVRVGEECLRRGVFENGTFVEEDDTVGNFTRKAHFVCDDEHGDAGVRQFAHDGQYFVDHFRVERGSRLIKQKHLGVHCQCPRDCHALLLTARKLNRVLVRLILQPDAFEQRHGLCFRIRARHLANADRRERDVSQNGQVREQVETLEDHANLAPDGVEVLNIVVEFDAVDDDFTGVVLLQPVERTQEG